ncbi:hypothetical protein A8L48_09375 [Rhizobium rhizogenes]|nr:hypothetical protein B0909_26590 [Rhizobium rhizogenes]OAM63144.1 hypothetical protein A8L48_09375 [Rhizobium rhizogenes]
MASRRQNAGLQTLFATGKPAGIFALHTDVSASAGAVRSRPGRLKKKEYVARKQDDAEPSSIGTRTLSSFKN